MKFNQSPPAPAEVRALLAAGMMDMATVLEPIYDAADGMKATLEARGWSPTAAEHAALAWLSTTLAGVGTAAMGGGR